MAEYEQEHILFLTGKLAMASLQRTLDSMTPLPFTWSIRQLGLSVAGLMTAEMIQRRLTDVGEATRILVPGRCRGDLAALSQHLGLPVERGPEDLKDLPEFFGKGRRQVSLDAYDVLIFAEIVDAPQLDIDSILQRAAVYQADGANVIDIGCLPDTDFPHLTETVQALKQAGYRVSVDSLKSEDLLTGGRAGADYLLSLMHDTLWIADEVEAIPILIPDASVPDSLPQAIQAMQQRQRPFIADPVLDPVPFGFTSAIVRYHALRQQFPDIDIMMGIGNLTELTDVDTAGINALLMGIITELRITAVLATQVSQHARCAIREADRARRIMYAARELQQLPKGLDHGLIGLHDKKPFPSDLSEIRTLAASVRDPNFRIQTSAEGIHIYNRDGLHTAIDPFDLFTHLGMEEDGGHAFYLGVELARAQIAWQLGKRYVQDEELRWGIAVETAEEDLLAYKKAGKTRKKPTSGSD